MRFTQSRIQLVLGTSGNDGFLVTDIVVKHLRKIKSLGLIAHDSEHVDRAGILQLRVFVQLI